MHLHAPVKFHFLRASKQTKIRCSFSAWYNLGTLFINRQLDSGHVSHSSKQWLVRSSRHSNGCGAGCEAEQLPIAMHPHHCTLIPPCVLQNAFLELRVLERCETLALAALLRAKIKACRGRLSATATSCCASQTNAHAFVSFNLRPARP